MLPNLSRTLLKTSLPLMQSVRKLGNIGNTTVPKTITAVNGGASVIIPLLEHFISNTDKSKNPEILNLVVTHSGISSSKKHADNPLVLQKFGQSCYHLFCQRKLEEFGYSPEQRPTMRDKNLAAIETISDLTTLLKEKHPEIKVNIFQLKEEDRVKRHKSKIYITNPLTGLAGFISETQGTMKSSEHIIIDASRRYGKFLEKEINLFPEETQSYAHEKTSSLLELYSLSKDELHARLRRSTTSQNKVAVIGAGLTTLWLLPVIAREGLTPIIIASEKSNLNYCKMMTHANAWIKEDLCDIFKCNETELENKLQAWTVTPDAIQEDCGVMIDKKKIIINEFFDCTGYCFDKGYLENIPSHLIINPYLPVRITFDYLKTVREQALNALYSLEHHARNHILEQCFTDFSHFAPLTQSDNSQKNPTAEKLYSILPEMSFIDSAIKSVERDHTNEAKNLILVGLHIRKTLSLLEQLAINDDILYNKSHRSTEDINERAMQALSNNQVLLSELKKELKIHSSLNFFERLQKDINLSSPDGRHYNLYSHAPQGSATLLSKMTKHLLGEDLGFNLFDGLTANPQIERLAQSIYEIPEIKNSELSAHYIQEILERSVRAITSSPDLFVYTKDRIYFKQTPHEIFESLYLELHRHVTPLEQGVLMRHKDEMIEQIQKAHLDHLPEVSAKISLKPH